MSPFGPATGDEEVCRFTAELIRADTTNYGGGRAVGEAAAAELAERWLTEAGLTVDRYERIPGRTNLIARWRGADPRYGPSDVPRLLRSHART